MTGGERAASGDEPANQGDYEEYVRGFDDVPVLEDVVSAPPRRSARANFVRGERRNARREERPDGYTLREASLADIETLYDEYRQPTLARPSRDAPGASKRSGRKRRSRAAG
jgi:hypothetical protein